MATILIVDDRPANREFLVTLLGYQKHRLLQASNGAEALRSVRAEHSDLVITDIVMPDMEGLETIKHIRRHKPAVKILAANLARLTSSDGAAEHQEDVLRQESQLASLLNVLLERKQDR